MSDKDSEALRRENSYLKQRLARMQEDVGDLNAEVERLRQKLEHIGARQGSARPDPLSGGQ